MPSLRNQSLSRDRPDHGDLIAHTPRSCAQNDLFVDKCLTSTKLTPVHDLKIFSVTSQESNYTEIRSSRPQWRTFGHTRSFGDHSLDSVAKQNKIRVLRVLKFVHLEMIPDEADTGPTVEASGGLVDNESLNGMLAEIVMHRRVDLTLDILPLRWSD